MATGRRGRGSDDADTTSGTNGGEYRSSGEVRTALIQRATGVKPVQYSVVDGLALFEGDIVLGTVQEVENETETLRASGTGGAVALGVAISGAQFRWPNCIVPYTIDPALPNQNRVTDAIAHWEANTNYRFRLRTNETDFITFRPASGCSSAVGRRGGQQFINLGSGCSTGNTIHEIGHAIGLWHEQSREDRDLFVRINWAKIQPGTTHNFNQHITDGDDIGPYDYGSIMHYPRNAFSIDGTDTITPINPPTAAIGQRNGLSPGDIAAANSLCQPPVVKRKEIPSDVTRKELIKDIRLDTRKEIIQDTRKEQIKDRVKEVSFDPIKRGALDPPLTRPIDRVSNPAVRRGAGEATPFAVAAPHQAPGAGGGGELANNIVQLDAQLEQIANALSEAETQREVLQQQYDETLALLNSSLDAYDQQGS